MTQNLRLGVCLAMCLIFWWFEPGCAYKICAYKKMCIGRKNCLISLLWTEVVRASFGTKRSKQSINIINKWPPNIYLTCESVSNQIYASMSDSQRWKPWGKTEYLKKCVTKILMFSLWNFISASEIVNEGHFFFLLYPTGTCWAAQKNGKLYST